jgi:hypothetical protein
MRLNVHRLAQNGRSWAALAWCALRNRRRHPALLVKEDFVLMTADEQRNSLGTDVPPRVRGV